MKRPFSLHALQLRLSKHSERLIDLICTAMIVLLLYAAVSKLSDYQKFQVQLAQSPMLSSYALAVSWLVPLSEILICLFLMFPSLRLAGLLGALALMNLFTAYIFAILHFSENIPCSCGGILESMSWHQHFLFNLFFIALTVLGVLLYKDSRQHAAG